MKYIMKFLSLFFLSLSNLSVVHSYLAINSVKNEDSDAMVSAGNTGALMTISKVILRSLPAIDRPAIVTCIPNQKKQGTVMLDMGANIDCDSEILY